MSVKSEKNFPEKIIIGTRGSPLALWQAHKVRDELVKISKHTTFEIKIIKTSGDWSKSDGEVRLKESEGGKGQFAKEIEEALLAGVVDIGVHSMKDMEAIQPHGLCIPFMLPREDARDAFLSNNVQNFNDLPTGSIVGTASVRRAAFVMRKRPDLKIVPFRGNVHTRIEKLRSAQVDATFLAFAGLKRLGLEKEVSGLVDLDDMLPAVGQGAIGIEMRKGDLEKLSFIGQISCEKTYICVECERSILAALDGSCHTPIGVYASIENDKITCRLQIVSPDGQFFMDEEFSATLISVDDVRAQASAFALALKPSIPEGIL